MFVLSVCDRPDDYDRDWENVAASKDEQKLKDHIEHLKTVHNQYLQINAELNKILKSVPSTGASLLVKPKHRPDLNPKQNYDLLSKYNRDVGKELEARQQKAIEIYCVNNAIEISSLDPARLFPYKVPDMPEFSIQGLPEL